MIFYFVRHGESVANVENIISNRGFQHPLTPLGEQQVEALAHDLREVPITHIYTSPLQRALQTAEIIGKERGITPVITDALREFDCGVLEGRGDAESWEQLKNVWVSWLQEGDLDARLEGGESYNDVLARFIPFIEGLKEHHAPTDVLVLVAHGGTYLTGLPAVLINITQEYAISQRIGNAHIIKADLASEGLICRDWCGDVPPL